MRHAHDIDTQPRRWAAAGSLLLHVLLIVLAVTTLRTTQHGKPATNLPKSIQITLAPPAPPAPPVVVQPPPEPPKEEPTPEPTPVPAKPKAVPKPVANPPPAKPAGTSTQEPTKAPPVAPEEAPEESLIGRLHDNWLEPARVPRNFSCLIRIDYLAGGRISAITFLRSCGEYELDESVRKAIWKSQPLPLIAAKTAAGSIEVEFTP